jgi:hypothetical protein
MTLALAAGGACFNHGTQPDEFRPAQSAQGAVVALRVQGESKDRVGELIAVDSIGITIREQRMISVAWPRVAALDVDQLGDEYDIRFGEAITPGQRARLALVSRFPQGISGLPIVIDSLIAETTRGTARFADRRAATAAGYRRAARIFPEWASIGSTFKRCSRAASTRTGPRSSSTPTSAVSQRYSAPARGHHAWGQRANKFARVAGPLARTQRPARRRERRAERPYA